MNENIKQHQHQEETITKIELSEDYILTLGDMEDSIDVNYNKTNNARALNNMHLRNWLREEGFKLGHIKGFFDCTNNNNSLHLNLCAGFVAFLFADDIGFEFIGFEEWTKIDAIPVTDDSRMFSLINILQLCSIFNVEKSNNFFIHNWENNEWFPLWSGLDVNWDDWINGPSLIK